MSQVAQPAAEVKQSPEDKAKLIIADTLRAFDISPEKAAQAKALGVPIDKIALFTGTLDQRLSALENAVIKIANGVGPAVDLANKVKEMEAARAAGGQGSMQPGQMPGQQGGIFQYLQMAQQMGLFGGGSSTVESFFVELGKKTLIDSMSLYNTINRRAMRRLSGEALKEYEGEVASMSKLFGLGTEKKPVEVK